MSSGTSNSRESATPRYSRREELFAFLVLAVLIWPVVALGIVGGFGFIIWTSQILFGPPGPPHH